MEKTEKKFPAFKLIIILISIAVLAAAAFYFGPGIIEKSNLESATSDANKAADLYNQIISGDDHYAAIGENSIIVVKKAKKDAYFIYSMSAVGFVEKTALPENAFVVISDNDSEYEQEALAYTDGEHIVRLEGFPKTAIMYNTYEQTDSENKDKEVNSKYFEISGSDNFTLYIGNAGWDGCLEYSFDGENWTQIQAQDSGVLPTTDDKSIYLRGKNSYMSSGKTNYTFFQIDEEDVTVRCEGDIMALLDYEKMPETIETPWCFANMFRGCYQLVKAPDLPATELAQSCYAGMFYGCRKLIQVPELPATELEKQCYKDMFANCSSLKHAPSLPAMELAEGCYESMFSGCSSLENPPELPATSLEKNCYMGMFSNCTNMLHTPELPALKLKEKCYMGMFSGCTSLTQAYPLPAKVLANSCYSEMFRDCKLLAEPPVITKAEAKADCFAYMFSGCKRLEITNKKTDGYDEFIVIDNTALSNAGKMFEGCSVKGFDDKAAKKGTYYFRVR